MVLTGKFDWVEKMLSDLKGSGEVWTKSLTVSPEYAVDFKLEQGFIEMIQNALDIRDELKLTKGREVKVFAGVYNGKFYVANDSASLGVADFNVGQTTKREDIAPCVPRGYFGTGLMKGVVVLLRNGYKLNFYTSYGLITPEIQTVPDEKYGHVEEIVLKVTDLKLGTLGTVIEITGPKLYDIEHRLRGRFLEFQDVEVYIPERAKRDGLYVYLVYEYDLESISKKEAVGRGFHRGIYITNLDTMFSYNFCNREYMQQESRNAFTDIYRLRDDIGRMWARMDNKKYVKKFIELRMMLGDTHCYEDETHYYDIRYPKVWREAWEELYGDKYVTSNSLVFADNPEKFILAPSPLYSILKKAGVPSEKDAHLARIEITRYYPTKEEWKRLNQAIDIAALLAGKRTDDSKWIREALRQVLKKNIYSRAVLYDEYGKPEDKTGEWAFVWNSTINNLYVRDQSVREMNVIKLATILLHELAHTKEVGALYEAPYGMDHSEMYKYYESILVDVIGTIGSRLKSEAKKMFGSK